MATMVLPRPSEIGHRPAYLDNLFRNATPPVQTTLRSPRSVESVPSLHSANSSVSHSSSEGGDWRPSPLSPQVEPQFALVSAFDDDDSDDDDISSVRSLRVLLTPRSSLRSFLNRKTHPKERGSPAVSRESSASSRRPPPIAEQPEPHTLNSAASLRRPSLSKLQTTFPAPSTRPLNIRKISAPIGSSLQMGPPAKSPRATSQPQALSQQQESPQSRQQQQPPSTNKPLPAIKSLPDLHSSRQKPICFSKPLPRAQISTQISAATAVEPIEMTAEDEKPLPAPPSLAPPIPPRSPARSDSPARKFSTAKEDPPTKSDVPAAAELKCERCYYYAARNCQGWVLGGTHGDACEGCNQAGFFGSP